MTGAWTTSDPGAVTALAPLHVGSEAFLEAKLKWRGGQPLTVLELRAWRLKEPVQLTMSADLFGCFSWREYTGHGGAAGTDPGSCNGLTARCVVGVCS